MASHVRPDHPGGSAGIQQPVPDEPTPGWRKPIALVGWGVLIAVLIGLIIWGIIQLTQGPPTPAQVTTTTPTTATTATTTAAPVVPPTQHRPTQRRVDHDHAHHRHWRADQQLAVARGAPAPALGDHAAVTAGVTDQDHIAARSVMRPRT
ncbi:MAG TPA: hypothetical protein VLL82_09560 [Mycobacterium sp.]|nr:hypothetical protein [Mycobacterium sp.]